MNKETERWVIIALVIMLLVAGLSGCAGKTKTQTKQPNVFDGSLSRMIGCIFAPQSCKDMEQEEMSEEEMTKEFTELKDEVETLRYQLREISDEFKNFRKQFE